MDADVTVDVTVVGGGPAGYMMAALLGRSQHSVAIVDPKPNGAWPNNYGSWSAEWAALADKLKMPEMLDCVNTRWKVTDCYFGGSFDMPDDERLRLDRPYLQVDRTKLKALLQEKHSASDVKVLHGYVGASVVAPNLFDNGLVHDASGSTLTVTSSDGDIRVRSRLVVDASGFESKLTTRESFEKAGLWQELIPGYQIAYGMTVDLEGGQLAPYAKEAMTLFDYRTDHLVGTDLLADAERRPSFVYVMPEGGSGNSAFFEETSLVGRGERRLEFETLRQRLIKRLDFHGIKYDPATVREEEYCYIPMGGALPEPSQRIVPFGGAANTVHPATGYQLCRMLASATDVAGAISSELRREDGFDADAAAAAAHASLWTHENRLQRDFAVFGGEFLGCVPRRISTHPCVRLPTPCAEPPRPLHVRGPAAVLIDAPVLPAPRAQISAGGDLAWLLRRFFRSADGCVGGLSCGLARAAGQRQPRHLPRPHPLRYLDRHQVPAKGRRRLRRLPGDVHARVRPSHPAIDLHTGLRDRCGPTAARRGAARPAAAGGGRVRDRRRGGQT